jgi:uncharacterized Tic20 family protein
MAHVHATQNIMIQELLFVLLVIIPANNVLGPCLLNVQAVIQQSTVHQMGVEDVNVWINTSIQELINFVLLAITNAKHAYLQAQTV